jgi:uracil DNA glycosylase
MLIVSILIRQKVRMPVLFDPMIPASLELVFIDIYNKPSRLRHDKSQVLQTFVHRIVKILNNQLTVKKMLRGREIWILASRDIEK